MPYSSRVVPLSALYDKPIFNSSSVHIFSGILADITVWLLPSKAIVILLPAVKTGE